MKVLKPLIVMAGVAICASCQYAPSPSDATAPGYPTDPMTTPTPGSGESYRYFREGHDKGALDSKNGVGASSSAHLKRVPPAYRDSFTRGYQAGYGQVSGDRAGLGSQAFQRGKAMGSTDRSRGLRYDPSRHFSSIQPKLRDEFTRGYASGW